MLQGWGRVCRVNGQYGLVIAKTPVCTCVCAQPGEEVLARL